MKFEKRAETSRRRARSGRRRRLLIIVASLIVLGVVLVFLRLTFQGNPNEETPSSGGTQSGRSETTAYGGESQSGQSLTDLVGVSGRHGAQPVVDIHLPLEVARTKATVLTEGEGAEVAAGAPVLTQIYRFYAENGKPIGRSEFRIGPATGAALGDELADAIIGTNEGSRVLLIRPTKSGRTEIVVVDVLSSSATGTDESSGEGPVAVDFSGDEPAVTHGEEKPTKLTVQTIKRGEGAQIRTGDEVLLQHLLVTWAEGEVISSSWAEGHARPHALDELWPGLRDALVDQRVGSRLAVTIPADQANGEDTIISVIDVLGTVHYD